MEVNSINKILVPVDLSPFSATLLNYVVSINKSMGAEIVLYHLSNAKDLEGYRSNNLNASIKPEDHIKQLVTIATQRDKSIRIDYAVENGRSVEGSVLQFAADQNIDLIILGKRRYSSLKEVLLGSKVTRIIKNSDVPVLCVPYSTELTNLENIVLLSDSFDLPVSLKSILSLAETCKAKINVLRVLPPDSHISENTLDWKSKFLSHSYSYPNIQCCETLTNDLLNGIHIWAEENNVSLIAVYPRGTGIFNSIDEDMAMDILQNSRIPVYIGKL